MLACLSITLSVAVGSEGGDPRHIEFIPFEEVFDRAREENRLVFLKPIYGGVDAEGAADYRCGSW